MTGLDDSDLDTIGVMLSQKRRFNVTFVDETGVDAGGLTAELYQQLFQTLFSGECSLLESVSAEDGGGDSPRFLPATDVGSPVDCTFFALARAGVSRCSTPLAGCRIRSRGT